jgi:hypothetical protein
MHPTMKLVRQYLLDMPIVVYAVAFLMALHKTFPGPHVSVIINYTLMTLAFFTCYQLIICARRLRIPRPLLLKPVKHPLQSFTIVTVSRVAGRLSLVVQDLRQEMLQTLGLPPQPPFKFEGEEITAISKETLKVTAIAYVIILPTQDFLAPNADLRN